MPPLSATLFTAFAGPAAPEKRTQAEAAH